MGRARITRGGLAALDFARLGRTIACRGAAGSGCPSRPGRGIRAGPELGLARRAAAHAWGRADVGLARAIVAARRGHEPFMGRSRRAARTRRPGARGRWVGGSRRARPLVGRAARGGALVEPARRRPVRTRGAIRAVLEPTRRAVVGCRPGGCAAGTRTSSGGQ
jgi:hypothetical protein